MALEDESPYCDPQAFDAESSSDSDDVFYDMSNNYTNPSLTSLFNNDDNSYSLFSMIRKLEYLISRSCGENSISDSSLIYNQFDNSKLLTNPFLSFHNYNQVNSKLLIDFIFLTGHLFKNYLRIPYMVGINLNETEDEKNDEFIYLIRKNPLDKCFSKDLIDYLLKDSNSNESNESNNSNQLSSLINSNQLNKLRKLNNRNSIVISNSNPNPNSSKDQFFEIISNNNTKKRKYTSLPLTDAAALNLNNSATDKSSNKLIIKIIPLSEKILKRLFKIESYNNRNNFNFFNYLHLNHTKDSNLLKIKSFIESHSKSKSKSNDGPQIQNKTHIQKKLKIPFDLLKFYKFDPRDSNSIEDSDELNNFLFNRFQNKNINSNDPTLSISSPYGLITNIHFKINFNQNFNNDYNLIQSRNDQNLFQNFFNQNLNSHPHHFNNQYRNHNTNNNDQKTVDILDNNLSQIAFKDYYTFQKNLDIHLKLNYHLKTAEFSSNYAFLDSYLINSSYYDMLFPFNKKTTEKIKTVLKFDIKFVDFKKYDLRYLTEINSFMDFKTLRNDKVKRISKRIDNLTKLIKKLHRSFHLILYGTEEKLEYIRFMNYVDDNINKNINYDFNSYDNKCDEYSSDSSTISESFGDIFGVDCDNDEFGDGEDNDDDDDDDDDNNSTNNYNENEIDDESKHYKKLKKIILERKFLKEFHYLNELRSKQVEALTTIKLKKWFKLKPFNNISYFKNFLLCLKCGKCLKFLNDNFTFMEFDLKNIEHFNLAGSLKSEKLPKNETINYTYLKELFTRNNSLDFGINDYEIPYSEIDKNFPFKKNKYSKAEFYDKYEIDYEEEEEEEKKDQKNGNEKKENDDIFILNDKSIFDDGYESGNEGDDEKEDTNWKRDMEIDDKNFEGSNLSEEEEENLYKKFKLLVCLNKMTGELNVIKFFDSYHYSLYDYHMNDLEESEFLSFKAVTEMQGTESYEFC